MAKEIVDYISLLPPPPHDELVKLAKQNGYVTEKLVFKEETAKNPLSGEKTEQIRCSCSSCGTSFIAAPAVQGCGYSYYVQGFIYQGKKYVSYDTVECPHCSAKVRISNARHYTSGVVKESVTIQGYENIDGKFAVIYWRLTQAVGLNKPTKYTSEVKEAFIFDKTRCFTISDENKWYYGRPSQLVQRRQFYPPTSRVNGNLPIKRETLEKSTMENSRLDKVLESISPMATVQYLRFYQSNRNVDTLVDIGAFPLIARQFSTDKYQKASEILKELDWSKKSPYKILQIDRNEYKVLEKHNISYQNFLEIRQLRAAGVAITDENIKMLQWAGFSEALRMARNNEPIIRTIQYLQKQSKTYQYLRDYWDMAKEIGLDMENPIIKYPKNLVQKHDEMLMNIKWQENESTKEAFRNLAQKMQQLDYDNGVFAVIAPKRERELIIEGKYLHHCVGGYGRTHCEGNSIFFVRKSQDLQIPYYTLQVNIKEGTKLQLHGYKNDAGSPIPQEVKDFVDYWLKNVFRRFDVHTMEFIDKPATA